MFFLYLINNVNLLYFRNFVSLLEIQLLQINLIHLQIMVDTIDLKWLKKFN